MTVEHIELPDGSTAWLVTGYPAVKAGLSDPRLSLNKRNSMGSGYQGFALPPALDANLLNLDPPDHTRLRKLVAGTFTTRRVSAMRAGIQRIADNLLDAINGPVDLIEAYAAPLPIIAIAELLGVPADRVDDFRGWTNTLVTQGPGTRDAVVSMYRFTVGLIAAKRDDPADDLISAMIEARDGSDRLTEDELLSLAFLILWAGYENSVHLIGNSVLTLLTGSASTIETLLRLANPNLHAIRRFPLADIEIDGVTIPAGQTVLLDIDGANRDPRHLDDPHVSFGAGVHHCLGAPMARLEAEIAIDSLFRRFPEVRLAVHPDELRWRDSFRSRGLLELPVTGTG